MSIKLVDIVTLVIVVMLLGMEFALGGELVTECIQVGDMSYCLLTDIGWEI
jgi:hypothetical protein